MDEGLRINVHQVNKINLSLFRVVMEKDIGVNPAQEAIEKE
jgi:hypothetical protein